MATEKGIVEKISDHKALVRVQKSTACATCESRGACQMHGGKEMLVEVRNDLHAREGDCVELTLPTSSLIKIGLLVYFFPILGLIVGAVAGSTWAGLFHLQSTAGSVIGGALVMATSFYILRRFDRSIRGKAEYLPHMTRILISADSRGPFAGSK